MSTTADAQGAADGMLGNSGALTPDEKTLSSGAGDSPALSSGQSTDTPTSGPGNQVPPPAKSATQSTATAPPPAPTHLSTFDKILDALGGRPKPTYKVNPQTGTLEAGPPAPMSTSQRLGMVVAAALTGLAASEKQPGRKTALGTFATGAGATISQSEQNDQDAKAQAINDFKRKQEMQNQADDQTLKKAQIFETNARTVLLTRQSENAAEDARQHYIQASAPLIESARTPAEGSNGALLREHLTQSQLLQEHSQPGARHATSNIYIPDGEIPATDPQSGAALKNPDGSPRMEYTFAEIDPNHQMDIDGADLDKAAKNGMPIPGYTPGSGAKVRMPAGTVAAISQFNQGVKNFEDLTRTVNSTLGLKDATALNADEIVHKNPQVGQAFAKMASFYDGQPSNFATALQNMQKDPKMAPYARTIVTALGGNRVDEFNEKLKANAKAIDTDTEEKTKLPYEVAKEDRLNAHAEARENKREHAKDDLLVIAGTPGSEDTQVMKKGDLPQGWVQYPLKDPDQLAATIRRTNDVQNKVDSLARFVQGGGMNHIQAGLVGDAIAEVNKEIKVGVSGTELPTARLNAVLDQENYKAMNEASRAFVRNYGFAREALTQLPALQSYGKSNRMNDTQLRAVLALLPDHRFAGNSKAALEQMQQLQGILNPLRKLPSGLPGAVLAPAWNETQQKPTAGAGGADPFAEFGGKSRNAPAQ